MISRPVEAGRNVIFSFKFRSKVSKFAINSHVIYISVQNTNCQPLVRVIIGHVFSPSIAGVQLFGGKFYKCVDSEGAKLSHTVVTNKTHCEALANMSYTWVNSKINFDNVLNGYLALFQVVSPTRFHYLCNNFM